MFVEYVKSWKNIQGIIQHFENYREMLKECLTI